MLEKINLEEILKQHSNICIDDRENVVEAMKEACKQILELAAENGEVRITENALIEEGSCYICYDDGVITARIDRKSILDTINQID